jgi:hypothetical protein
MPFRSRWIFFWATPLGFGAKLSHSALLLDPEAAGRSPKIKAQFPGRAQPLPHIGRQSRGKITVQKIA